MSTQPTPMQTDSTNVVTPISWEGDRMFNIYIYDYCHKRGFRRTAKELLQEAEISPDATPPINARQGLLFEWWSVFWVLFQAKSNGGGSDDALVYINHQNAQRQLIQRGQVPPPLPPLGAPPAQPQTSQPAQNRLPNGTSGGNMQSVMTRPASTYMPNGAMTNGMNPTMGGQPPQQGQPMPPSMNFGGMGAHPPPQPNGIPSSSSGPPPQQPPQQGNASQPMTFTMMPNQQRPPSMMNGMPQQRGSVNGAPFQGSPTMSHSPQHNAGPAGHHGQPQQGGQPQSGPPQQGGPGQQAPMAQLGPSPHMPPMRAGGMMPPNGAPPGMSPMIPGQQQQQQQGPPTPGYQQQHNTGGRPPSRTNTPRGVMHPSPSMAARQTPGVPGPSGMGPSGQSQGMPMAGISSMVGGGMGSDQMNSEIMQIPQSTLNGLKVELGIGDKDISNLTTQEKSRILGTWKQRGSVGAQRKDGQGTPGMMQASGPGQQPPRQGGPQPSSQQRPKRNSTSPSEAHESLPRNESSPPERKRARRSPGEPPAITPISYAHPGPPPGQQPGQPGQSTQSHMQQLNMIIQQQRMNGMPMGGPGAPPPQQQQQHPGMQPPSLAGPPGGMPLSMMQMVGGNPMMSPQQQQQQMHQANQQQQQQQQQQAQQAQQQQLYRMSKQPGAPEHSFNPAPPPTGSAQFSPLNRLQNKPSMSGMMPPPSPAVNGPAKDANKDTNNANKGPAGGNPPPPNGQQPTHNPDGSPRNPTPGGGPSGGGTAPPTPVPSNQPNPQQQQQQQPPPPPPLSQNQNPMMNSAILGMAQPGGGMGPAMGADMLFDPGFMDGMGGEFDPSGLFRPDGDINFERDFGQWFNPDDNALGAGMDLK